MRRQRGRLRNGFVLVMVLTAIIVVGVAMTTTARKSLLASVAAIESQQAMQRDWGMRSCQQVLLNAGAQIFEISDRNVKSQRGKRVTLPSIIEDRVILSGQTFDLILADEDAKAELNALYDAGGKRAVERAISQVSGAFDARTTRLMPVRPSTQSIKRDEDEDSSTETETGSGIETPVVEVTPAFRSWGEVFDLVQVHQLAGDDRQLAKMTRALSLQSSGRLNVFRASDDAVLAVCKAAVEDALAKRLLSKIRETSWNDIRLILEQTITNVKDRNVLQSLLGNSSNSFSLWIETTGKNVRQQRFAVQAPSSMGVIKTSEFSFE